MDNLHIHFSSSSSSSPLLLFFFSISFLESSLQIFFFQMVGWKGIVLSIVLKILRLKMTFFFSFFTMVEKKKLQLGALFIGLVPCSKGVPFTPKLCHVECTSSCSKRSARGATSCHLTTESIFENHAIHTKNRVDKDTNQLPIIKFSTFW